ncbi:uncharacterized protein BHQ10_007523 [Talaromyces amestolkiae]|uniref:Ubiquitin-like protease family profile domain-containing protein n=1 Tax=Talaromyces amestolkiae TaxID=1196081 RepID=A0A364L732_TALAM|nr:uncharacterized protein BHQ10_007523 [Talaromyces amestolkiae]RAO71511.1 hypothetical protein BHQ10_007523 [Talaromyces amestolkiae]
MDLATASPRQWLYGLAEKLLKLADMVTAPEMKGVESVSELDHHLRDLLTEQFRDSIHRLCQDAPAVAEVIAATIREKIPDPSLRSSLKRKPRHDPSYRPSYQKKRHRVESVVPETVVLEHETEHALDPVVRVDTTGSKSESRRESRSDFTLLAAHQDVLEPENMYSSTTPILSNREQTVPPPTPQKDITKDMSFNDTLSEIVNNVSLLKKHPDDLPRTVHQKILQSLHTDQGPFSEPEASHWSDGKAWLEVLEKGSATSRRCIVFNMLEHMGASKWYDGQIEVAKRTVLTKQKKPVDEKGAAMHVLGRITNEPSKRKAISNQFSRGKRVRLLVKELGLGIILSSSIWKYTKRKEPEFNQLLLNFKADSRWMALFQTLTPQLELLVRSGSTDPEALYDSLGQHHLVSNEELQELMVKYALEHESLSDGALNAAYTQLISRVSKEVFKKQTLSDHDTFIIDHSLKLPADIFYALRPGQWLDCWVIKVAMHIADRPAWVHFRESIPVNDIGRHERMRSIKKPFSAWAKEMVELRRKAEGTVPLTFYTPVHHINSHFTLLEIDDGEKVIRHYDSMAEPTVINGTEKTKVATLVEDEFNHLGYRYIEMPTPQQSDNWSCGARVIWAFRKRCNGFDIGSWDTVLDSGRIQLDIVNSLTACIDSNAMQKYSRSRGCRATNDASMPDFLGEERSKQGCVDMICVD